MDQGPLLIRDLLSLEARAATGQLEVTGDGTHTVLYLVEGKLVYAEGGSLQDMLSRALKRDGTLTSEQYVDILQRMTDELVEHEEVRFGEVAIQLGYASPQQVTEGLIHQVRSRLLGCLQHEDSEHQFNEGSSYTERVPRFPVDVGPVVRMALEVFYSAERIQPVLAPALTRHWRLGNPADLGSTRFAFTRDDLQVVRQLKEPILVAELLGSPPSPASLRVALLLALAGLVEVVEPPAPASERPTSPPPPETPTPPEPQTPNSRAMAAELANLRARALMGLTGASGGARPTAPSAARAAEAIAALQGRQFGAARAPKPEPQLDAATHFERGRADLDQGRLAAARQQFEHAYAANPSDEHRLYLAWARYLTAESGNVTEPRQAVEICMMDCLRADRRMAFAHYVSGRLALVDNQFEAAEKALKLAVALDSNLTDAARSLRLVQQRRGGKK